MGCPKLMIQSFVQIGHTAKCSNFMMLPLQVRRNRRTVRLFPKKERAGRRSCLPPRFKHALMSAVQDQIEGQRALLEAETLFVTKTRAAVLGIQGTQLRALAMFAEIFERHPYPVVINAAILKLADWFRTRYCLKKYSKNNEPNFQRKERKG